MTERTHLTPEQSPAFPESFMYDGVAVDPLELFDRYASSEMGKAHAEQRARYGQDDTKYFFYGTSEQMVTDLGPDVHPVHHMRWTYDQITVPLLSAQPLSREAPQLTEDEKAEVAVTTVLHDIGEASSLELAQQLGIKLHGDVGYGTKSPDSEAAELAVRSYFFRTLFSDVPARLLGRVNAIESKKDMDDLATETFDVIERLGYYETGKMADTLLITEKFDPETSDLLRVAQLGRLASRVSNDHYAWLRSKQYRFPHIKAKLDQLDELVVV